MTVRDLAVLVFTLGSAWVGFFRPWLGVLALAVLAYMNPHRYAWGFMRDFPVYFVVFMATAAGIFLNGRDRQPFPWTRETKLFMALLAWFSLTTFWDPDIPDAAYMQWVKVMKIYLGIFPTLWMITTRERLRWLLLTIALSFGLIGFKGGLFAIRTAFHYRVWGPDNTFYGGNNEIAAALNMTLPLLWYLAGEVRSKWAKVGLYSTFVLSIFSVISSWSRGGLLGLLAVLGALVLSGKRKWLVVPLVLVTGVVIVPRLPEGWFSRMETIKTYDQDESVQGRFVAWRYAWEKALENPLTGGGFETFRGDRLAPGRGWVDVHSAYFEILGEHGFVALALWLSLLFGTMVALQRIRRWARTTGRELWMADYARAIQISLLGYAVGGLSLGIAYWDYFYHLVAITVILKILFARAFEEARAAEPDPVPVAPMARSLAYRRGA